MRDGEYFPGFEPDFQVRQELKFCGGVLDLRQFDKIFISVSGGKDSHAMLFLVRELAERQGVLDRLIAMYADTGMEWHNAGAHVERICSAAGVPLEIVYPYRSMIDNIKWYRDRINRKGGGVFFPTVRCRYCTANQKIQPMDKLVTKYTGMVLKVTGERWQESKARSAYSEFVKIDRMSTKKRRVYGWRPMLAFKEADIWAMVRDTGIPRHVCYDMGCDRLGCAGCIFSGDHDLKIEMRENPVIFEALDRLEVESGYTMSMSGKRIRERIK